ncbi:MAG TPA: hypothetical protein P5188_13055 [Flavobacterium sp.]|nr:hypothetical protein [Flavobacterium sp.]
MVVLHIKNLILLLIIILLLQKCENKHEKLDLDMDKNSNVDLNQIDSLKYDGFLFTRNIDFFSLTAKDTIIPGNFNFYAFKKSLDSVTIINFIKGKFFVKRLIKKHNESYFIEERSIDSSDGGEISIIRYYYNANNIIITEITKSIYEKSENNSFLNNVLIINVDNVIEYSYKFNNHFDRNNSWKLNEEQLLNIESIVLNLFYDKNNVDIYEYPFSSLKKETSLWDINL